MDHLSDTPAESFVFQGVLDEADMVQLFRYTARLQAGQWLVYLVVGVGVLTTISLAGVVFLLRCMGLSTPWYVQAAFASTVLLWAYPLVARGPLNAWLARGHYRRHASEFLKTEVILSADRVATVNEAHRSEYRWTLVGLVAATPDGLLFCNQAKQPLFSLPNRVLDDDLIRADVLTLAEANGVFVRHFD